MWSQCGFSISLPRVHFMRWSWINGPSSGKQILFGKHVWFLVKEWPKSTQNLPHFPDSADWHIFSDFKSKFSKWILSLPHTDTTSSSATMLLVGTRYMSCFVNACFAVAGFYSLDTSAFSGGANDHLFSGKTWPNIWSAVACPTWHQFSKKPFSFSKHQHEKWGMQAFLLEPSLQPILQSNEAWGTWEKPWAPWLTESVYVGRLAYNFWLLLLKCFWTSWYEKCNRITLVSSTVSVLMSIYIAL